MSSRLGYEVWDADNHMYEAVDAYTRHLPKRYEGAIRFVDVERARQARDPREDERDDPEPHLRRDPHSRRVDASTSAATTPRARACASSRAPIRCPDEFRRPDLRLRLMDEQGIDGCVLFPTTAGLLEEHMKADLELTHAVVHAYNQWLLEDWTFDYEGRIIPTPVVTLPDVGDAVDRARVVPRPRREDRAHPSRPGAAARRLVAARRRSPTSTRSGSCARARASR